MLNRRQLLRLAFGTLATAALPACRRQPGPRLLACEGSMPRAWLADLPQPWQIEQPNAPEAIVEALASPHQPQATAGLVQLSDGWASTLPLQQLKPLDAPQLLAGLSPAAAAVSRLYAAADAEPRAFPWAFSPWVVALRNRPDLVAPARQSWEVLLEPSLRGRLVLPSSPRVSIALMQADPAQVRRLRQQALACDERQGLNLLLAGEARAAVLPLQRLIPLLRRDPRLQVVLPDSGAPLTWQLLLRPAGSRTPLPMAWLRACLQQPVLSRMLADGWVPPLPRSALDPAMRGLPEVIRRLLLPPDAVLQRCWSLPPLPERQRLAWQTLWDAAAP